MSNTFMQDTRHGKHKIKTTSVDSRNRKHNPLLSLLTISQLVVFTSNFDVWGKKLSGVESWSGVMEWSEISVTSRQISK